MPLYTFICKKCNKEFDSFVKMDNIVKVGEKQNIDCSFCSKSENVFRVFSKIVGMDGKQQPWEYDYTHRVKPKYVRDSDGNRIKFNPNTMKKGRKGSGI